MTGSHCIIQLEIWERFKFPLGPGQPLMGVQEAKPQKLLEILHFYSTKKSLKIALSLCIFPLYCIPNTQKIHENPERVKIYYFLFQQKIILQNR